MFDVKFFIGYFHVENTEMTIYHSIMYTIIICQYKLIFDTKILYLINVFLRIFISIFWANILNFVDVWCEVGKPTLRVKLNCNEC